MGDRIRVMHMRRTAGIVGGPETLVISVAKYLDRDAFDLTVIDFGRDAADKSRFLQDIEAHGIPTAVIPAGGKFDFRAVRHLASLLEERRIDILHVHDHRSDFIAYFAARRRPTLLVNTFHQPLRRYWWLRHVEMIDEHIVRRFDRVLPVAEAIRQEMLAKRPQDAQRVITVLNGVDLSLFRDAAPEDDTRQSDGARGEPSARRRVRRELGIADEAVLCATIGRVMEDKGLGYLIDAQQQVTRSCDHVRQILVGIGPDMDKLTRKVRELGLDDRIQFTGHRRDIPEVLAAADLLVVSSLSEGLSVAIIEAMAAGKPVVATRVGGTPEIVVDGETGLIVEPRDSAGLADAIVALVNDPARRKSMGRYARELAFSQWSVERMVRDFERVYRDLMHERSPAS
jgi:glycosyltransferase involved in cell wall biosynthesis